MKMTSSGIQEVFPFPLTVLDVLKNPEHNLHMRSRGVMHKLANNIDNVSNVRSGETVRDKYMR